MKFQNFKVFVFLTVFVFALKVHGISEIQNILSYHLSSCTPFLMDLPFDSPTTQNYDQSTILNQIEYKVPFYNYKINVWSNILSQHNYTNQQWPHPSCLRRFFHNCFTPIVQIRSLPNSNANSSLNKLSEYLVQKLLPIKSPLIRQDVDKVIFLSFSTQEIEIREIILHSTFSSKLKFKVLIEISQSGRDDSIKISKNAFTSCKYCGPHKKVVELGIGQDSSKLFPDFHQNMGGTLLRISVGETVRGRMNYTFVLDEGRFILTNGMLTPAVEYLAFRLNFTYQIKPSLRGGGTGIRNPESGEWDGLVADIMSGDGEIAMSVAETYDRTQVVGFTGAVVWEHLTLITPLGKVTYPWVAIFWPLSPPVWLTTLGMAAFSVIYFCMFRPKPEENSYSSDWTVMKILECVFIIFFNQSCRVPQNMSNSTTLYLATWYIASISLTTAYLSKLVNFLTFPIQEKVPETIEQLSQLGETSYDWGLAYVGGVAFTLINSTKSPVFERIVKRMEIIRDHSDCFTRPLHYTDEDKGRKFVCLAFESLAKHYIYETLELSDRHGNARVAISHRPFASFSCGVMMTKRAVFGRNLQLGIDAIVTMGLANKWEEWDFLNVLKERNNNLLKFQSNSTSITDLVDNFMESNNLLTLKHLHGARAILCAGILVTIFIFVGEVLVNHLRKWKTFKN